MLAGFFVTPQDKYQRTEGLLSLERPSGPVSEASAFGSLLLLSGNCLIHVDQTALNFHITLGLRNYVMDAENRTFSENVK